MKIISFTVMLLLGLIFLLPNNASAVVASDWKPGRIIDDAVFTDNTSMTVAQIQQFLDSKMTGCDTKGTGRVSYEYPAKSGIFVETSRALYSYRRGNGAVTVVKPDSIPDSENSWYTQNTWFRCINDYWENPNNGQNNYANRPIPAGAKSAANLIWDAAQAHNISPKVLLVTLQKEQSLVTDTWPFQNQYLYAMGAYCPDGPNGANCNPAYAGFGKQIKESADLFRYYLDNMYQPWWSNKKPGNNFILWQVTTKKGVPTNCGGSNIYIENMATAALYTYTPYQPNQAALNNMEGEGDYCSAYGNRNFWRQFHDWFGTTYTNGYVAQYNSQSGYPPPTYSGQSNPVFVRYKNLGSTRWYDSSSAPSGISPVHIAATNPINRQSIFSYGWVNSGRPSLQFTNVYEANGTTLSANQHVVEPGQIAKFEFNLTVPYDLAPGVYREHFQPVLEGASSWNIGGGVSWFDITVLPSYQATYVTQSAYPDIPQNSISNTSIQYKNTGYSTWFDSTSATNGIKPVSLATTGPINRRSIFSQSWPLNNRPNLSFSKVYEANGTTLSANQRIVNPGQIAQFDFNITTGADTPAGTYREFFQPVVEGSQNWAMGGVSWIDVTVRKRSGTAQFYSQSGYPSSTPGQQNPVFISYRNNTNFAWYDSTNTPIGLSSVNLATTNTINRPSIFSWGWPLNNRPNLSFSKVYEANGTTLSANQHIVNPGQIVQYNFNITAPWSSKGLYREFFQPVVEGSSNWNISGLSWLDVFVNN